MNTFDKWKVANSSPADQTLSNTYRLVPCMPLYVGCKSKRLHQRGKKEGNEIHEVHKPCKPCVHL